MDLSRTRDWSYLTSDFRTLTFEKIQDFDRQIDALNLSSKSVAEIGNSLASLSRSAKVGYSMGLCPWTDAMLLETFSSKTRRLLIIMGQDWYPIVKCDFDLNTSKGYAAKSPLVRQSPRDEYPFAFPQTLTTPPDRAIVFMNLYPDFRPPGMDCTGNIGADKFVAAFKACCREFSRNYTIDAVMTWGDPVWQALRKEVAISAGKPPEGIMTSALSGPFNLVFEGLSIPYHPFSHPSYPCNFKQSDQFEKFQSSCSII